MSASNKSLKQDVLAREIPNRAALVASGFDGAEHAMALAKDLHFILEHGYELRLKPGHDATSAKQSAGGKFTGRPITSKYPGACRVCRRPYAIGDEVLWSKAGGCAHITCGELEADR